MKQYPERIYCPSVRVTCNAHSFLLGLMNIMFGEEYKPLSYHFRLLTALSISYKHSQTPSSKARNIFPI